MENNSIPINVIQKTIERGLFPYNEGISFHEFKNIFIDLDSILSILLKTNLDLSKESKKEYANIIINTLGMFINEYHLNSFIHVYYNMDRYIKFPDIYPDWCKERMLVYQESEMVTFIHDNLIRRMKILEKNINNFKLIKCEDSPILYIKEDIKLYKEPYLIISRDEHYLCLFIYDEDLLYIYDGKDIFNKATSNRMKHNPDVKYMLLPYYFMINGLKRNEYNGIKKFGKKRTTEYLKRNIESIIQENDNILSEVLDYKDIFFLNNINL